MPHSGSAPKTNVGTCVDSLLGIAMANDATNTDPLWPCGAGPAEEAAQGEPWGCGQGQRRGRLPGALWAQTLICERPTAPTRTRALWIPIGPPKSSFWGGLGAP